MLLSQPRKAGVCEQSISSRSATVVPSGTSRSISDRPARSRSREKNCTWTFIHRLRGRRDQIFPEHADVRQVPVAFHVIEPVTDHEFVRDLESNVIGFHHT